MDSETTNRIREVIRLQFDVEILHKDYEQKALYSEITRRKEMLKEFKQLLYYDYLCQAGRDLGHQNASKMDGAEPNLAIVTNLSSTASSSRM